MQKSRLKWGLGGALGALAALLLSTAQCAAAPGTGSQASRVAVSRTATPAPPPPPSPTTRSGATTGVSFTGLRVRGNQIVNKDGAAVRLLGFNSSGAEYACMEGWGIFDGAGGERLRMRSSTVAGMVSWRGVNTVRVPLNEQCWLGLGVKPAYGGRRYQQAIRDYVHLLNAAGIVVVLDLHRSAPGKAASLHQEQMPDRDHSLTFWRQVATAYRNNSSVVFDLFNEPWPYADPSSARAWRCWRDGGCRLVSQNGGAPYTAAGMNELIAAIRSTGAHNVLAVGGIHWAEMLDRWLQYRPSDPMHNLVASFHNYSYNRYCKNASCYDTTLAKVAAAVPLYVGEVGPDLLDTRCTKKSDGHTGFSRRILDWLDRHGSSYTSWTWNRWGDCYSLVSNASGTPTPLWGREIRARLAANAR